MRAKKIRGNLRRLIMVTPVFISESLPLACHWHGNWVTVIRAYFDESYDSRMFAVAGIVGKVQTWVQIEAGWQAAIRLRNQELFADGRKQISRYHAAEMNAHDNEFKGWGEDETRNFAEQLLAVLYGREIFITSFAVKLDDLQKVFPEWCKTQQEAQDYAYRFAFHDGLLACGHIASWLNSNEGVDVWYDHGRWDPVASEVYAQMRNDATYAERERFTSCASASSLRYVGLQSADMMAYECWRESERIGFASRSDMRKFFRRIAHIDEYRISATYADERYFREIRENMEKGKSDSRLG